MSTNNENKLEFIKVNEPSILKDHEIAKIVSDVQDIAVTYAHTQQLRQNLSQYLVPILKKMK